MNEKGDMNAQLAEEIRQDDRITFDSNEWEEVPFSFMNASQDPEAFSIEKNLKIQEDNLESGLEKTIENGSEALHTRVPLQQEQVFLLEYGKKYTKYKKYKHFEQYFHEKYEKNLYFDPTEMIFFTPDGLKFKGTPGNSVGTSLLYESSKKTLAGFSNNAFNLELSTANKELEDQIEQMNQDGGTPSTLISSKIDGQQNRDQTVRSNVQEENGSKSAKFPSSQGVKNKSTNNLESIFDWIEKKDKLNKKRISKENKIRSAQKDQGVQNESVIHSTQSKKTRSMNYFIRKLEK